MYLPLAGYDPDKDKHRRKMSVNSVSPSQNPRIVQPVNEAVEAHQQTEKIQGQPPQSVASKPERHDETESQFVQAHYSAPSLSTQDFMILRAQSSDDQFQALDAAIEKIKENTEQVGELLEALHKLNKAADPDNLALQVLTKTLEAMDEASGEK